MQPVAINKYSRDVWEFLRIWKCNERHVYIMCVCVQFGQRLVRWRILNPIGIGVTWGHTRQTCHVHDRECLPTCHLPDTSICQIHRRSIGSTLKMELVRCYWILAQNVKRILKAGNLPNRWALSNRRYKAVYPFVDSKKERKIEQKNPTWG